MDASLPQLELLLPNSEVLRAVGLTKSAGVFKDRETYPDYEHVSGTRLELKLLYVEPGDGLLKVAATRREPSARITQKVTLKNVHPDRDILMVLAYQLRPSVDNPDVYCPEILDVGLFSMIECVLARDHRLISGGGRWFGEYETPAILSQVGRYKLEAGLDLDASLYGRKKSEERDFNEDTNFGKLKRIPYRPLQEYLKRMGASYSATGTYPEPWAIGLKGLLTPLDGDFD